MIKSGLTDQIYDIVRDRITSLQLDFGQRIDVQKLADEFEISQTPILFALNRLSDVGLVARKARTGYYVLDLEEKDLEDIYDLREMFEIHALKTAIKNLNLRHLNDLKLQMQHVQTITDEQKRKELFHEADCKLHLMIVDGCDNKRAKDLFMYIYGIVNISIFMGIEWEVSLREHIAIIDAIVAKDLNCAKKILEKHIRVSRDNSIAQLRIKKTGT